MDVIPPAIAWVGALLAYLVLWRVLIGMGKDVDDVVASDKRGELAKAIFTPNLTNMTNWSGAFAELFDKAFGRKCISRRRVMRSMLATLLATVVIAPVWLKPYTSAPGASPAETSVSESDRELVAGSSPASESLESEWPPITERSAWQLAGLLFIFIFALNIIPDYLSLSETRFFLVRVACAKESSAKSARKQISHGRRNSFWQRAEPVWKIIRFPTFVVLDIIATGLIYTCWFSVVSGIWYMITNAGGFLPWLEEILWGSYRGSGILLEDFDFGMRRGFLVSLGAYFYAFGALETSAYSTAFTLRDGWFDTRSLESIFAISLWTTYVTSVWIWLAVAASVAYRLLQRWRVLGEGLAKWLGVKERPFAVLGLLTGAVLGIIILLLGLSRIVGL